MSKKRIIIAIGILIIILAIVGGIYWVKLNKEQEKIREGLLKYCELDTYAIVKIWEKLKEI